MLVGRVSDARLMCYVEDTPRIPADEVSESRLSDRHFLGEFSEDALTG